jgi:glyoxylase-like metal-dependent hydrolase (beta-lactamase superfamily II)
MKTTGMMRTIVLVFALGFASQAQAQDEPVLTVQKLSETVSVLFGQGGNIGVSAGPDGVFIIDDQYEGFGEMIKAAVAGISERPINYVLNTHWHFDHAGSNEYFGRNGSVIIGHDNVRKMMVSGAFIRVVDVDIPPAPAEALPAITFDDSLSLHLNGEEVYMFHVTPAHTDGDGIVWFKDSNIIHMGDTFLNGIYPLVDIDAAGSIDGMITTADTVMAFINDETQIIPGHGPIGTKADLKAYRDMCITVRDRIVEMKGRGMSLEEVLSSEFTKDLDGRWNTWGDDWKKTSFRSVYWATP